MTDREILDRFNAGIRATEALAVDYQHVAVEVPPGRPQIAFFSADRALLAERVTSPRRSRGGHARRPGGPFAVEPAGAWVSGASFGGSPASTWPLPSN
jgi:hypothetical protein